MANGKLYLIPVPISENTLNKTLPEFNETIIKGLRFFLVERTKSCRQFLRKVDAQFPIDDTVFIELDKHESYSVETDYINILKNGNDVGLVSESGYPAVADPGHRIVAKAQENGIEVIPMVGPSSILMALAASGLNGQGFTFNGYLPVKDPERSKEINFLVQLIQRNGFSQIFIETPYRNEKMFEDLVKNCPDSIKLCVAFDITGVEEKIITKTIGEWKKSPFKFEKFPCVFILGKTN